MGKELIFQTLKHEKTHSIPWVPFSGVHAGKLKGYTAEEVLKDEDKLVESLLEVKKVYEPDGMPIVFDLQVEAEILGCDLLWAKDNPPSVKSHPLSDEKMIPCKCKIPTTKSGRIPLILNAMNRVKAEIGNEVALYGLICGPFTLASHLRGSKLFMDMRNDKKYVTELMEFCGEVACKMSEYYIDAGMDVIAVVDPLISQVSPKHIDSMLAPAFTAVFDYIRNRETYSSFFVCGNATNQIDAMCRTNPDSISIDENVNLAKAKEITDKYNITIGGNIPLTTTMLFGNQQDNMVGVIELIDSVKDHRNFIVSPGCDMPYDTPIQNTIAAGQAVKRTEEARKMIENYEAVEDDIEVTIPDYDNLDKVLIEIFLLDPDACAACTYMLRSVTDIYDEIKDITDYKEYRYNNKEDIARIKKMGVRALPSIYINGKPKWESIIPSKDELIQDVKDASK